MDVTPPRHPSLAVLTALLCACAPLAGQPAVTRAAGPTPTTAEVIDLAQFTVAEQRSALLTETPAAAAARLFATAGGVNFLPTPDAAAVTLPRALATAPGIIASDFLGGNDQPKIHVRGSGLQQNPVQRGLVFLSDGLPLNLADGSVISATIEPRSADYLAVYRGAAASVQGATSLGGAIDLHTPTYATAPRFSLAGEAGSFGARSGWLSATGQAGNVEGWGALSHTQRDGYRAHNTSERTAWRSHVDGRVGERLTLRAFFDHTESAFDVAGPLPYARLLADPRQVHAGPVVTVANGASVVTEAGPNVLRDRPQRDTTQWRTGVQAALLLDEGQYVQAGFSYLDSDDVFQYPVSGGIQSTQGEHLAARLHYGWRPAAAPWRLEADWLGQQGDADKLYRHNDRNVPGQVFGRNDLDATSHLVAMRAEWDATPRLTLGGGLGWTRAERDNADRYGLATRPTLRVAGPPPPPLPATVPAVNTSFARDYDAMLPQASVRFRPAEGHILFATVSRSFEAPTFEDLLATSGGTPNSGPTGFTTNALRAQRATTLEAGWRGRWGRLSWDAVAYRSRVEDELLIQRDAAGVALGTVNAARTRHTGLELGGRLALHERLSVGAAYTYQDFRFEDDPVYRDRRLAGAPRHHLAVQAQWTPLDRLAFTAHLLRRAGDTPVDNANTLFQPGYTVADFGVRARLRPGFTLFAEVRNAFDKLYAVSALTTDLAAPTQAMFIPGDGRSVHAGFIYSF